MRQPADEHSGCCAAVVPVGEEVFFVSAQALLRNASPLKLFPALRACTSKRMNPEGVLALRVCARERKRKAKFGKPRTAAKPRA